MSRQSASAPPASATLARPERIHDQASARAATPLVHAQPPHGCGAYGNGDAVFDGIVLVERGANYGWPEVSFGIAR